eukprot:CAMPEP_0117775534 /NCGR_PEP_ID=MMETSP0947-20121206/27206_1 /TAXON_ID=44440 /ORGANISM="Chattonella subsalsa, Strain CCMP2191" /LENGTH=136 /DNA_ID=CAMNT_0005602281 /DNA_START=115 /DNA_END=525 /DNA_ORIENTATION=-
MAHARTVPFLGSTRMSWWVAENVSENICFRCLGLVLSSLVGWRGLKLARMYWSLGKGTKLVVISFKSTFKSPGNLMELVRCVSIRAAMSFIWLKPSSAAALLGSCCAPTNSGKRTDPCDPARWRPSESCLHAKAAL